MLLSFKYGMHSYNDKILKCMTGSAFKALTAVIHNNQIKCFLEIKGFEHVWQNKGTFSKTKLIHTVNSKLLERYNIFFKEAVSGNMTVKGRSQDKLRTFKTFKNKYKMEYYINMKLDKQVILTLLD